MTRDYTAFVIQEARDLIENVHMQEQAVKEGKELKNSQKQKGAEKAAEQARERLRRETQSSSAIFQFLAASEEADATAFRTAWQMWQWKNPKVDYLSDNVRNYYKDNFELPYIDLTILPTFSFVLQFTFTLTQPYISHDEQDFYIIDNPIRKDKVFGLPYVASTSWKGSLRAALWHLKQKEKTDPIRRLFGNEKDANEQEFRAGRLYFFPTFFTQKGLEIINPHDRQSRTGTIPIPIESVPKDSQGVFTLLYVPFDRIGKNEQGTREELAEELDLVAQGLQAMFRMYGFGAKTSSGFGLVREAIQGTLRVRASDIAPSPSTDIVLQPQHTLERYLETPQQLKSEYLTAEGTFRERSAAELSTVKKSDQQLYEKAKKWWEREEKRQQAKTIEPEFVESTPILPIPMVERSFNSFEQLLIRTDEIIQGIIKGDEV